MSIKIEGCVVHGNKIDCVGWQPIETAPKDGTVIDLWGRQIGTGRFTRAADAKWAQDGNRWCWTQEGDWHGTFGDYAVEIEPSHWMLPPAPPMSQTATDIKTPSGENQ